MTGPEPERDEPQARFASAAPSGYEPPQPPLPPQQPPLPPQQPLPAAAPMYSSQPGPTPTGPAVSYGRLPGNASRAVPFPFAEWGPPLICTLGGILAFVGSLLNWVTIKAPADSQDLGPSQLDYSGLSLLEGRIMLVLGLLAIALSVLLALRRSVPLLLAGLSGLGAIATIVMLFAAIGHPVEIATLYHSVTEFGESRIRLPGDVGMWLALAGALLILIGGLAGYVRRIPARRQAAGQPS